MLTPDEQRKTINLCKTDPYKAMDLIEFIFEELQMKNIHEFAAISTVSERTLYNYVSDPENAKIELSIFCNYKYIPAALNQHLLHS